MSKIAPKQQPVVIIGAGPAGLTAAYELSKLGCFTNFEVVVVDDVVSREGILIICKRF